MACASRIALLGIFLLTAAVGCETMERPPVQPPPGPLFPPRIPSLPDERGDAKITPQPVISESQTSQLPPAKPADADIPLPINLSSAMRLSNAQPLIIAAAEASMRTAVAQYDQAKLLWLPNVYAGASYLRHDGLAQGMSGNTYNNSRDQLMAGGTLSLFVSAADAIFAPLAAQQVLRARTNDIQAARNDALLTTAEAYFNVQQARGQLAGAQDVAEKAQKLVRTITALSKGLTAPIEADRAATELADVEQSVESARAQWRVSSAELARALLLPPNALVAPMEPPHLQVTLIPNQPPVDRLIEIALTNRPELASQQAMVQATLVRLRQERMRPLIPIVAVGGDAAPTAPYGYLMGGYFGADSSSGNSASGARNDLNVMMVWELRNLGLGNRALVRERQAERDQAVVESYRVQTQIASEVVSALAQIEAAAARVGKAETGLKKAQITFAGNVKGLSETTRFGDLLILVNRPQEAVAALQQLARAYDNYFLTVNDYNRAQFRLFRALGYPSSDLICQPLARSSDQADPAITIVPLPQPDAASNEPKK